MALMDLLTVQEVAANAPRIAYRMAPSLPLAWVIGAGKTPMKIHGQTEVEVPLHGWSGPEEREAAAIQVMLRMAEGAPVSARDPAAIDRALWTKLRFNSELCILNPVLRGRLFIPERSDVLFTEGVPGDRILCLGRRGSVGTLMVQGDQSGYVLPVQKGVAAIRIYSVS